MIAFEQRFPVPVRNHFSGREYQLHRMDRFSVTPERIGEVVHVCNEPQIYEWLFREMTEGNGYQAADAAGWFRWAKEGWHAGTHFCFVVTEPEGGIAGAIDLKSADADGAEMGCWASGAHPGIMTNVVMKVCELAREAGFRSLKAAARHGNERSRGVLARAGFAVDPEMSTGERDWFRKDLRGVC